ncbi:secreted RxLR effector protein 161-like [Lycium barbarum]|uniref:secreted RxLR effector protein 161-like n=1 Tax=Lycium barbarum TaxID=112863 RepID=UPI00293F6867|nr:secreted RxLR effector protein 161-like [Lycium barbarum]
MVNCKVVATPMNINEKLCHDDGTEMDNATYFRSLVGGLNYLSHTRPDIAFSVGVVSRFMHSPSKLHLGAAKRILRYIAGTTDHGIWYSKAGSIDDRKSTSGFLFNLGSGAISWSSKKQEVVALSTSEAEYIAATLAACQTACDTNEQAADIFTKSLPQAKHEFFRGQLGVCKFESRGSVEK